MENVQTESYPKRTNITKEHFNINLFEEGLDIAVSWQYREYTSGGDYYYIRDVPNQGLGRIFLK